ncbi:MAG: restriction endonuclease subunit S, partial [Deferribacteraceae bacterium]|nr:restriction endonuclease subunit S [Deferribacteraceae bacterium]
MSYDIGEVKNIHYGDILVKFGSYIDLASDEIPYIKNGTVAEYKSNLLQNGDVVFADTAEDETVGKAVEVINTNCTNIVAGLHTMAYRPKSKFSPYFMAYYLNTDAYRRQLLPLMQGVKVLSLSRSNLAKTLLSYPTMLEEQAQIGTFFRTLDTIIATYKRKLDGLRKLKKA